MAPNNLLQFVRRRTIRIQLRRRGNSSQPLRPARW